METELPIGWEDPRLNEIVKYRKGKKPKILEEKPFENSLPYLDIMALELGETRRYSDKESSNILDSNSIAIVWDGARSGWVAKGIYGAMGSTIAALTPVLTNVDYLFYFLKSQFDYLNTNARGIGIPHVDPTILWNLKIPLAPLPEQTRIVAKLDALFAHIDTLKTKLDRIPELLKNFRQQVLTQAVTGKLTEEWRKGKELEEWGKSELKDFADCRLGKMLDQNKNVGEPTDYLRNTNVRWFSFDFSDISQMKVEESEIKKFEIKLNDILVCEGGEPGRAAIWKNEHKRIIYQKALHRIRLNNSVLPNFFLYNLYSDSLTHKLDDLFTGTTIKHLTGQKFATYKISIPPIEEQTEIVRRVEELFQLADTIEARYKSLKEKIDTLPQAILTKAFKGELVPQNPNDEPASVLLERIKQEKAKS